MSRLRNGYANYGPIQIPPQPMLRILTDRTDGSQWALSFNAGPPERLSISSNLGTIQTRQGAWIYGAFEGPYIDNGNEFVYRVLVRSGRIGIELVSFPISDESLDGAPLWARNLTDIRNVIVDPKPIEHIGYLV